MRKGKKNKDILELVGYARSSSRIHLNTGFGNTSGKSSAESLAKRLRNL